MTDLAHECAAQEMRFFHSEVRGEDAVEDDAQVPGRCSAVYRTYPEAPPSQLSLAGLGREH